MPDVPSNVDPHKVVKRLFEVKGVESESELTVLQVETVSKLKVLAYVFGSDVLDQHLDDFMLLQVSKDRKGRSEFVDSLKSLKTDLLKDSKDLHLLG